MKKFIMAIVFVLFIFGSFVGCNTDGHISNSNVLQLKQRTIEIKELYGFDSQKEMDQIDAPGNFGIAKLNTDKRYIQSGEGSMYVRVDKVRNAQDTPNLSGRIVYPWIKLYTSNFLGFTDFSNYSGIALDVYNASDRDTSLKILLTTSTGYTYSYASVGQIVLDKQIALKDCWNRLIFPFDEVKAPLQGISSVTRVDILFDEKDRAQTSVELYIDSIGLIKGDRKLEKPQFTSHDGGKMICDYEDKLLSRSALAYNSGRWYNLDYNYYPILTQNMDVRFVKEGKASLKVSRPPDLYKVLRYETHRADCGFFAIEYLRTINFSAQDINTTSIYMDIYNDYEYPIDFMLIVGDEVNTLEENYVLTPNAWNTIEFKMNKYLSNGTMLNWNNIVTFNMGLNEYFGHKNADMYIDNIRFGMRSEGVNI